MRKVPPNAELIRNLMIGAQYIHDHVMHFYHLHALDWVDVVSALSRRPCQGTAALAQSLSSYPRSSEGYFRDVQKKVARLRRSRVNLVFLPRRTGDIPEYKLPAEANLMAVAHYLDALEWQRDVARLHTIFGGKNPHPNFRCWRRALPDRPELRLRDQQRSAWREVQAIINKHESLCRAGLRS